MSMPQQHPKRNTSEESGRKQISRFSTISVYLRWCTGVPLVICAVLLFQFPGVGIGMLAPLLAIIGVLFIANEITLFLSRPAGSIFWPRHVGPPRPMYGIPESRVARGQYAEAEAEYEKIIRDFPNEVKPHIDMINIAILRMNNAKLAEALYQRGMSLLKDPAAKENLTRIYTMLRTRLK